MLPCHKSNSAQMAHLVRWNNKRCIALWILDEACILWYENKHGEQRRNFCLPRWKSSFCCRFAFFCYRRLLHAFQIEKWLTFAVAFLLDSVSRRKNSFAILIVGMSMAVPWGNVLWFKANRRRSFSSFQLMFFDFILISYQHWNGKRNGSSYFTLRLRLR